MKKDQQPLVYSDNKGVHFSTRAMLYGAGVTVLGAGVAIFGPDIVQTVSKIFHGNMPTVRDCTYSTTIKGGESSALEAFQRATGGAKPIDEQNPNQLYMDAQDAWLRGELNLDVPSYNLEALNIVLPGQEIYWTISSDDAECPDIEESRK